MFTGLKVLHKKFGEGIIISCDMDDIYSARLTVEFADSCTSFALKSFADGKFFNSIPDNLRNFASDVETQLSDMAAHSRAAKLAQFKMGENKVSRTYELDEERKPVSKASWQRAYNVAGEYRFSMESRAVIVDGILYINATAACIDLGKDHRSATGGYNACETGKKFLKAQWSYATKEDIFENCLKGDNE